MRSDRTLAIVLGLMAVGLVLLVWNDDAGETFGLANYDFARLLYFIPIAGVFGVAVLNRNEGRNADLVRQAAIWLAIVLALVVGYRLYHGEPVFPSDNPAPAQLGTGITASLMNGVDGGLHLVRPHDVG